MNKDIVFVYYLEDLLNEAVSQTEKRAGTTKIFAPSVRISVEPRDNGKGGVHVQMSHHSFVWWFMPCDAVLMDLVADSCFRYLRDLSVMVEYGRHNIPDVVPMEGQLSRKQNEFFYNKEVADFVKEMFGDG